MDTPNQHLSEYRPLMSFDQHSKWVTAEGIATKKNILTRSGQRCACSPAGEAECTLSMANAALGSLQQ